MAKKLITRNYIYNLIYQILVIILPIITTPYLARTLGPEGTGTYSYTISIVTYFILFGTLGVTTYGQREIAYVQDDVKKRSKILYEIFILRFVTMAISMFVFYLTFGRTGEYSLYYKILLLEMFANIIDISFFYQGLEDFKKPVIRNIVVKILSVISIFIFVKDPDDLVKYFCIYVLTTLFGNITMWVGLKKYATKVKIKDLNVWRNLKPTLSFFIPQIATQIYTVLDKTMIGTMTNDMSEVGFYEQSQKVVRALLTIITSLGAVMMPRIARCFSDGNKEKITEYMHKTFKFVFMLAFPLILGIIGVTNNFVPVFFGQGYDKVKVLLPLMSIIILFIGLSNVTGTQYLLSTKNQRKYTISVVCGAVINVILNFILIRYIDSLGATIATVIAEFVVISVQFYFIRKEFKIKDILALSKPYILPSIIMFVLVIIVGQLINITILALIVQIVLGVAIYFGILLIRKDDMVMEAIGKVKGKLIKSN